MLWIIKMLLKIMKPFAKMAILEALMDYVTNLDTTDEGETEPAVEDTTE